MKTVIQNIAIETETNTVVEFGESRPNKNLPELKNKRFRLVCAITRIFNHNNVEPNFWFIRNVGETKTVIKWKIWEMTNQ